MRYLLLTIFSILLLSSVIAQVKNGPDGDIVATGWYPVVKDTAIKGGYRSLPDTSARNSIKDEYRKAGMQVYTESDTTTWQLMGCLTNNCWVPVIRGRINAFFVDTITLLARVPRINGTVASVSGYHTPADGGGGQFFWNDTSTATANGGTIISVAGISTGRWFRIFQGEVNVKWFGAWGNRTTDDAAAIQAAIDTKLPVYIPPGFYRLNSTINLTQRPFRGASTLNTYFFSAPNINVFTLGIDATQGRFANEISGFTVRTESADTSANNYVFTTPQGSQRSTGYKIHHVEINGTYGAAFWLYDTYRMDISHVGISRCNNGLVVFGQVVQCSFYDVRANCDLSPTQSTSTLLGNRRHGIYINSAVFSATTYRPENVTAINCSFVGFQKGAYIGDCLYSGFNQCDFDLTQNIGVDIYNADGGFFLTNSWINMNGTPLVDSSAGVRIYPSTTNRMPITVQNNNISISNSTSVIRFGIQVGGPSAAYYFKRNVNLIGNNITSQFTYGIYANRVRELTCNGNNITTAVVQEFFGDNIESSVINDNVCDTIQYSSNSSTVSVMNNRAVVFPSGTSTTLSASNGIIQATTAIVAGGGGTNSRKLYVNGSMGIRKDSLPIITSMGAGYVVVNDSADNQLKRISQSNLSPALPLNSVLANGDSSSRRIVLTNYARIDSTKTAGIKTYGLTVGDTTSLGFLIQSIFYGDSDTFGAGLPSQYPYPYLIGQILGWNVINRGQNGTKLQYWASPADDSSFYKRLYTIPVYVPGVSGYLSICYSINDARTLTCCYDTTTYKTQYNVGVDSALLKGWPLNRIVICTSPFYTNLSTQRRYDYATATRNVAASRGTLLADFAAETEQRRDLLQSDSLHMNIAGHQVLAYTWLKTVGLGANQTNINTPTVVAPYIPALTTNTFRPALWIKPDYSNPNSVTSILSQTASGSVNGTYTGIVPTTVTGYGTGLVVNATVTSQTPVFTIPGGTAGINYRVGDKISIPATALGGSTGSYTFLISGVTQTNTFDPAGGPLVIDQYLQSISTSGGFTPFQVYRPMYRDAGTPGTVDFGFGYNSTLLGGFIWRTNGVEVLRLGATSISTPAINSTTGTFTSTLSTVAITNSGGVIQQTGNLAANVMTDATTNYSSSSSFVSNKSVIGGSVGSLTITNPGSGYTNGTYPSLTATGGSGTGLVITVTVSGGVVTAAATGGGMTNRGSGYQTNEVITATIPGGSGFTATINLSPFEYWAFENKGTFRGNPTSWMGTVLSRPVLTLTSGARFIDYLVNATGADANSANHYAFYNNNGRVWLSPKKNAQVGVGDTTNFRGFSVGVVSELKDSVVLSGLRTGTYTGADSIFIMASAPGSLARVSKTNIFAGLAATTQLADTAKQYSLPGIQVVSATGTYAPPLDRTEMFYRISAASGNVAVTIDATGLPNGYKIIVLRGDSSGNTCSVALSTGNINGSATLSLPSIWSKAQIIYDSGAGFIVAD